MFLKTRLFYTSGYGGRGRDFANNEIQIGKFSFTLKPYSGGISFTPGTALSLDLSMIKLVVNERRNKNVEKTLEKQKRSNRKIKGKKKIFFSLFLCNWTYLSRFVFSRFSICIDFYSISTFISDYTVFATVCA